MKHYCWFIRLLFLLLVMLKLPAIETRALRGHTQHSDIIAGNEFLKLFLERDEQQQRDLHSSEYEGGGRGVVSYYDNDERNGSENAENRDETVDGIATTRSERSHSASVRSLENFNRNGNEQTRGVDDGHKSQVVKLVTSGSKIVFLEDEYDEDDAVADAVEIELQKERKSQDKVTVSQQPANPMSDEIKVVAVSVSSSSQRTHAHAPERYLPQALTKHVNNFPQTATSDRQEPHHHKSQNFNKNTSSTSQSLASKKSTSTISPRTATTTTTTTTSSTTTTTVSPETLDFINRSHKSEFLIEETEPLTMLKNAPSFSTNTHLFHDTDSENSASTNIRNVLAIPAGGTDTLSNSSARNGSRINQSSARSRSFTHSELSSTTSQPNFQEDKLLPFQTVIYHDTREGHGPQSRSISYSSISQNVEDLQNWQKSGILAEAQRNVSESLKPMQRPPTEPQKHTHGSEPAKFYSLPAQMYSVPAKFYSEPAKVYSEPAKVYGQPEKVYSEPAKVYGEPAKFYSEPAKVYSQPAKVYSEPAKTYWPRPLSATTTTSTTTAATISSTTLFTTTTPAPFATSSSRRPAIVSRIAFGEAQTTQVPTDTGQERQTQSQHHYPNQHNQNIHHNQQQQQQRHHFHRGSHSDNVNSQPRRVLFNLDRLPYDLLNAPAQTPDHHISSPTSAAAGSGSYNVGRQRPCWEPPTSSTSSQQHQPHSSLLLDEHSNQNAKGLPNRDLVKCVSKYSHSPTASLAKRPNTYTITTSTTESSHIAELYTPTPEQNYEIEESVSVMTNGRAHGAQLFGGPTAATTTTRSHLQRGSSNGGTARHTGGLHYAAPLYNTNANANVDDVEQATDENYDEDPSDGNSNTNSNNNESYDDDVNASSSGNQNSNNNGKDDSKVAYVLEGRNFRKYRVEEKTDDGFIVGEYGVVDHQDGNLRGVRYTADSTINRSLIQKALLTFLKLK